jgi:hypothetical protein
VLAIAGRGYVVGRIHILLVDVANGSKRNLGKLRDILPFTEYPMALVLEFGNKA